MRALILGAALGALAGEALAQGQTRTVDVGAFTVIDASAGVDVEVAIGPTQSVVLTGDPKDFDRLDVRVVGGRLKISPKRELGLASWGRGPDVVVKVSAPRLEAIEASSAADVVARGFTGGDLRLDASSGADLVAVGTCASLTVDASSGADVNAGDLRCARVKADASSGADVVVRGVAFVEADASSGADVIVKGKPERLDSASSSGGSIRQESAG